MAKAILACENVKEFASRQTFTIAAAVLTVIVPLAENFLLRNRPSDAGDSHRENYKPENLCLNRHLSKTILRFAIAEKQSQIANQKREIKNPLGLLSFKKRLQTTRARRMTKFS